MSEGTRQRAIEGYTSLMNSIKVTPKDFFLWAGAMVALYGSVISFITLLFSYIDQVFPDVLARDYYNYDPFSGAIRFAMASLIVLVPVTLVLLRLIRKDISREPEKTHLWIRRWALYLTIFIAGFSMVVDLITLVNYFLGGELTTRFILKVAVVLLVAGAVFMHFLADLWGYWTEYPTRARMIGYAAALLVIISIVSGFFIIGSPTTIRMQRFDSQKVTDLQNIQWQVINYYQSKSKLPTSLTEAEDPLSGAVIPVDPQTGEDYVYRITKAPYTFELCATFNEPTAASGSTSPEYPKAVGMENETWQHGSGETCFERTIDPERYPPFPKGR